jgi:hypothetical protein
MALHPNHLETVRRIKNEVIAAGIVLEHGPGECGRFEVTKRVAFALKDEGFGLIAKFGGQNKCAEGSLGITEDGFAVDAIMDRDGVVIDLLGAGVDGPNTAQWFVQPHLTNPNLWREPFPVVDGAIPVPMPTPTPGLTLENRVALLETQVVSLLALASTIAGIVSTTNARLIALEARPVYTRGRVNFFGVTRDVTLLP